MRRRLYIALTIILSIYCAGKTVTSVRQALRYQGDLELYLDAAQGFRQGANPYHAAELAKAVPTHATQSVQWFYPPHQLVVFELLDSFGRKTARILWIVAELAAAAALLWLWWRLFGERVGVPIFLTCAFVAFRSPLLTDIRSGNVSIFEQLLLWTGILGAIMKKPALSGSFFFLASQWKWTLSYFAITMPLARRRRFASVAIATFLALTGLTIVVWLATPALASTIHGYLDSLRNSRSSEWESISWDGRHFTTLYTLSYLMQSTACGLAAWITLTALAFAGTLHRSLPFLKTERSSGTILRLACFLSLGYAIAVPRFKDYSALLLAPALMEAWALSRGKKSFRVAVCAVLFLVSVGGVMPDRTEFLARMVNGRFLFAVCALWTIYFLDAAIPRKSALTPAGE